MRYRVTGRGARLSFLPAFFFFFILAPISSHAFADWQPIDAAELAMKSEPLAPGAAAIVLYRQVDRDDNTPSHENNYVRVKILTEEGRKYADVEIPFLRGVNDVANLKARTVRPDGTSVEFQGKPFEKYIVKAKGVKYLAKTFTLPDVEVGSIIEYYYTYDYPDHWIYDSHWIISDELFTKHGKFSLRPYSHQGSTYGVRWTWQGLPKDETPKQDPKDGIIRLEVSNVPAFQTEDYMPPQNELKARVDFIYSQDEMTSDSDAYWRRVGKRLTDGVESGLGKHSAMEQAAGQIVSPGDTPDVKLQKLYARVQQLRNTSYELKKTEQEEKRDKEKANNNVADVWKRGYGSSAQLDWLYIGLVRAAGFDAYAVAISDRSNYFFNQKLMDASRLDGYVVLIKSNGKDIFCDPGTKFAPFGLLPWYKTGVEGLLLNKDNMAWLRTPLPESAQSQIIRTAQMKLSDTGDLEGKLTVKYTGLEAMVRRNEERNQDEAERKKFLEDTVQEYIPAGINVELTNRPDWDSSASELVAEYDLKVPGWVSGAGHRALVPAELFGGPEKRVFEHANRSHPIYFEFPFQKIDDVTIDLPPGWKVTSLPTPQKQGNTAISYELKLEDSNGKLHIMRTLKMNVMLLETKYYTALRNFYQSVRTGDELQIVLQPGTATASN